MRFQSNASTCGPASLRNALLCHGISRSEEELETLSGCTAASGTSPRGLLRALAAIAREHADVAPGILKEGRGEIALLRLLAAIRAGHPVVMCVDREEHWVTAFGMLGHIVHVADPADPELVQHYGPDALLSRWKGLGRKPFYGIIV